MASNTVQLNKDNVDQTCYSDITVADIEAMGLKDCPPYYFSADGIEKLVNGLLSAQKVIKLPHVTRSATRVESRAPGVDAIPDPSPSVPTARTCPYTYHNSDRINMKQIVDWWCLVDEKTYPTNLARVLRSHRRKDRSKTEPITTLIASNFAAELDFIFEAVGLIFSYSPEMVIGTKVELKKVAPDHDWSKEVIVIYHQKRLLLSGQADSLAAYNIPSGPCAGAFVIDGGKNDLAELAKVMNFAPGEGDAICIHEFKSEENFTAKGLAQVKAVTLGSMTITKCQIQAYIFITPTKWVFGIIRLSHPLGLQQTLPTTKRENYTLAVVELKHQEPVHRDEKGKEVYDRLSAVELERIFRLWVTWTVVPPSLILDAIVPTGTKPGEDVPEYIHLV